MPTLYSYCIPIDDGAAPNPFWGVCTLVICKPAIRRTAKIGDWVVATGAKNTVVGSLSGKRRYVDVSGKVVYAMRITDKLTMKDYDHYTQEHLREKIPDWNSAEERRRLGDSIYDFVQYPPRVRPGVHMEKAREHDLGGKYALLSEHFYYFGDHAVPLPEHLLDIVKQGQGHRSRANAPYLEPFQEWLYGLGLELNRLHGSPHATLSPINAVGNPLTFFKSKPSSLLR